MVTNLWDILWIWKSFSNFKIIKSMQITFYIFILVLFADFSDRTLHNKNIISLLPSISGKCYHLLVMGLIGCRWFLSWFIKKIYVYINFQIDDCLSIFISIIFFSIFRIQIRLMCLYLYGYVTVLAI